MEHQLAHAKSAGFAIDEVAVDKAVSGLCTRLTERPEDIEQYLLPSRTSTVAAPRCDQPMWTGESFWRLSFFY